MREQLVERMWSRNRVPLTKAQLMAMAQKPRVVRDADTGEEYSAPCLNVSIDRTAPRPQQECVWKQGESFRDKSFTELRQ